MKQLVLKTSLYQKGDFTYGVLNPYVTRQKTEDTPGNDVDDFWKAAHGWYLEEEEEQKKPHPALAVVTTTPNTLLDVLEDEDFACVVYIP